MKGGWSRTYPKPDWFYRPETTDEEREEWSRREIGRRYREKHPERIKESKRRCRAARPETQRALTRGRRAVKKAASGKHTAQDIARIAAAQKFRCAYCRTNIREQFDADHIVPLARGGSNDARNIQLLCVRCNRSKSSKDPLAFAREEMGLLLGWQSGTTC